MKYPQPGMHMYLQRKTIKIRILHRRLQTISSESEATPCDLHVVPKHIDLHTEDTATSSGFFSLQNSGAHQERRNNNKYLYNRSSRTKFFEGLAAICPQ